MFGHLTYLVFELAWGTPVVLVQAVIGMRTGLFRQARTSMSLSVVLATTYFSAADAVAIRAGIWTISPTRTLGLRFGNLPIEEFIFFLLTSLMIVQGYVLLRGPGPRP